MTAPAGRMGRISSAKLRSVRARASERDLAVLRSVEVARLLSARHVERVHFSEGSPLTRARRCRAVLQRLTDWGCLVRLERRIGGVHAGSAGYVYALAPFGQRLLHPGTERLRRVREPSAGFVDHVLATAEVWVRLVEAERSGRLQVDRFEFEPSCWRSFTGPSGALAWVKPDAKAELVVGEWEVHSFIEVDLDTESSTVIRNKAEAYAAYFRTGTEQDRIGLFPKVVFLVPDERRTARLVDTLARLDPELWQLFQVVLLDEAVTALGSTGQALDQASG
jgi:hypothetical protein